MASRQLKGHLDLLLLAVLDGSPLHGYAIIGSLRDRSGGEFDLPEGTVYPALHRLEKDGLVASRWSMIDGRRRRVYQLTGQGAAALVARRADWASYTAGVDAVIAGALGMVHQ
jgi:PadR family transcriptional regulator PadR